MFTHQVRERHCKIAAGRQISFPNTFEASFFLQPLQPFGGTAGDGRTAIRAVAARTLFNANNGHHFIQSETPLQPLEVEIREPDRTITVKGNRLVLSGRVESYDELDATLHSIFFGLPILLNVEFADPPVVERVEGRVGDVPFRWELDNWRMEFLTTTQDEQEQKALSSWARFNVISNPGNRRLLAALHYFHVFCRLSRAGQSPWEFMAEAIVNLSKILEVLFPPTGDGLTIAAARVGLGNLGYSRDQVERHFIPSMALRNNIDSAHVDLSIFTVPQLRVIHSYTEAAELAFRELLSKILTEIEAGEYQVTQYTESHLDDRTAKIVERLSQHQRTAQ
jgi:hypothetical protein